MFQGDGCRREGEPFRTISSDEMMRQKIMTIMRKIMRMEVVYILLLLLFIYAYGRDSCNYHRCMNVNTLFPHFSHFQPKQSRLKLKACSLSYEVAVSFRPHSPTPVYLTSSQ